MTDEVFQGLPVWHCFPGSISDRAGVRKGDIVLIANGVRVDSADAYLEARSRSEEVLELTLLRGQRMIELRLDLADQPGKPAATVDSP